MKILLQNADGVPETWTELLDDAALCNFPFSLSVTVSGSLEKVGALVKSVGQVLVVAEELLPVVVVVPEEV